MLFSLEKTSFQKVPFIKAGLQIGIIILFSLTALYAETVEIVSNFSVEELGEDCFKKVRNAYELRISDQKYKVPITTDFEAIKRFVIFNTHDNIAELDTCPKEKKVLFVMEPLQILPQNAENYSRIYTWDDEAVDNEKFFKLYFPCLLPMVDKLIAFEARKLCTMVVGNWDPQHRRQIVEFFATKPKGEFEFYGSPFPNFICNKFYKGRIPGLITGEEKIAVLKNYRFCICFENTTNFKGYITEKIFPCFAAGCVPIYFGAANIEDYIPKKCFIDYRDFKNDEELYQFIKKMPKAKHEAYLHSIRAFLKSAQARVFSPRYFANTLYEAVSQ